VLANGMVTSEVEERRYATGYGTVTYASVG